MLFLLQHSHPQNKWILAQKFLCNAVFPPTTTANPIRCYFPDAKPIHAEKSNVLF
jgi:hypothetical protein